MTKRVSAWTNPTPWLLGSLPLLLGGLECVRNHLGVRITRANIVIDEKLMKETPRLTGLKTNRKAGEWDCARCGWARLLRSVQSAGGMIADASI